MRKACERSWQWWWGTAAWSLSWCMECQERWWKLWQHLRHKSREPAICNPRQYFALCVRSSRENPKWEEVDCRCCWRPTGILFGKCFGTFLRCNFQKMTAKSELTIKGCCDENKFPEKFTFSEYQQMSSISSIWLSETIKCFHITKNVYSSTWCTSCNDNIASLRCFHFEGLRWEGDSVSSHGVRQSCGWFNVEKVEESREEQKQTRLS